MTNGEPLVVRAAMKPLSTLTQPLRTVDTETREPAEALRERTDSTTVPAAAVVGEAMVALVLADAYRDKLGGDHIDDVLAALGVQGADRMAAVRAKPAIVFIGFMGAGKSNAARAAAERLGEEALDADEEIEPELGEPIASFFEREGEGAFRDREERVALELLERGGVVSLGGGAVESERVREAVRRSVGVWCRVDEETAWERPATPAGRLRPTCGVLAALPRARAPVRGCRPGDPSRGGRDIGRLAAPWLAALDATPR